MNDNLRPILEASYAKNKEAKNILEKNNYKLDKGLSTKEAKGSKILKGETKIGNFRLKFRDSFSRPP